MSGDIADLLRVPTRFVLSFVRARKEAVALLRIGQAAEEFDWLVEKMCEYLERGAALKSHIIRLRASPAKSTAVLLPILAQVEERHAFGATQLSLWLNSCKAALKSGLDTLSTFAEQNFQFSHELEAEQITSLAKQKRTLAIVESSLCERIKALLSGDDGTLRQCTMSASDLCAHAAAAGDGINQLPPPSLAEENDGEGAPEAQPPVDETPSKAAAPKVPSQATPSSVSNASSSQLSPAASNAILVEQPFTENMASSTAVAVTEKAAPLSAPMEEVELVGVVEEPSSQQLPNRPLLSSHTTDDGSFLEDD